MNEIADKDTEGRPALDASSDTGALDFIRRAIVEDLRAGRFDRVQTRFPPEPNGYLHIGHAKPICIDFGIARDFGGVCSLRFDDTNPAKEEQEYVDAIMADIRWLGFDWGERLYFASGYFEELYAWAVRLIEAGKAYVDDLSPDEVREHRGTLTEPGRNSPYRDRTVEENLDLFARMRAGEFPEGSRTLRAKIDMASPNLNLRDPVMYRILHKSHHRTGDDWCIYPLYDWAHGQNDSMEGVTHSMCDVWYEDHRPLYDWFLDQLGVYHPRQIEFGRFNLSYTLLSKRHLRRLVEAGQVRGWDDPRMPTLAGLRRLGYPPEAIVEFHERIGIAKNESVVDIALLEYHVREHLNRTAPRVMGVLRPLRLVIENYPEGEVEWVEAVNNPEDEAAGARQVPFSRVLYVEQDDYREDPPKGWFRLAPGKEVRLKHAYYVTCREAVRDPRSGEVVELRCTYDPETRGGSSADGRRVLGTLHWVSAAHAADAEVRLYDRLFCVPDPSEGGDFFANLNPNSMEVLSGAKVEPGLAAAAAGARFQFLRNGYFCVDPDSVPGRPVFNRTITLKDTWAKVEKGKKQ